MSVCEAIFSDKDEQVGACRTGVRGRIRVCLMHGILRPSEQTPRAEEGSSRAMSLLARADARCPLLVSPFPSGRSRRVPTCLGHPPLDPTSRRVSLANTSQLVAGWGGHFCLSAYVERVWVRKNLVWDCGFDAEVPYLPFLKCSWVYLHPIASLLVLDSKIKTVKKKRRKKKKEFLMVTAQP